MTLSKLAKAAAYKTATKPLQLATGEEGTKNLFGKFTEFDTMQNSTFRNTVQDTLCYSLSNTTTNQWCCPRHLEG